MLLRCARSGTRIRGCLDYFGVVSQLQGSACRKQHGISACHSQMGPRPESMLCGVCGHSIELQHVHEAQQFHIENRGEQTLHFECRTNLEIRPSACGCAQRNALVGRVWSYLESAAAGQGLCRSCSSLRNEHTRKGKSHLSSDRSSLIIPASFPANVSKSYGTKTGAKGPSYKGVSQGTEGVDVSLLDAN